METTSPQTSQQTHKRKRGEQTPEPRTHKRKRGETTPKPRTNTDVPGAPKRPGKKTRRANFETVLRLALKAQIATIKMLYDTD